MTNSFLFSNPKNDNYFLGDGYNSSFRNESMKRSSSHVSAGESILRRSLANLEHTDPELAKKMKKSQKGLFNKNKDKKEYQILPSGIFMPGMSEGILDANSSEEEEDSDEEEERALSDNILKKSTIVHTDYEAQVVDT